MSEIQTVHKMRGCYIEPITIWQAVLRDSVPIVIMLSMVAHQANTLVTGSVTIDIYVGGKVTLETNLIAYVLIAWYLAEAVTMLTNHRRRAIHDFIADTIAIRTNVDKAVEED